MSTDRSPEPFAGAEAAAAAVAGAPGDPHVTDRLLETVRRFEAQATTDHLTGALNRRGWARALGDEERRCARYGHAACVVVVDLDGLKAVNDALGHRAGDDLLRLAVARLLGACRATDVLARVGGDEFALLAVDTDLATARVLVARLADALRDAGVPASVGVAEREPDGGLGGAWSVADRRMYAAKRRRRLAREPRARREAVRGS